MLLTHTIILLQYKDTQSELYNRQHDNYPEDIDKEIFQIKICSSIHARKT